MNKKWIFFGLMALAMTSCKDDDTSAEKSSDTSDGLNGVFDKSEWLPGGELGTGSNEAGCYENPTPAVEAQSLTTNFNYGELFFERDYTYNGKPFNGLGPAWVRRGCLYCHPRYGHGKRMDRYRADDMGNGYLLVVYHPEAGVERDGVTKYAANSYVSQVTGMPQTAAQTPFLPPIDESQITITWNTVTAMESGLSFTFPDGGDTYQLIYPDVKIPESAFNTDPKPVNYEVRLESTIGIIGSGILDAISEDDMLKQYQEESAYCTLNPAMWDSSSNTWASSAWYTLADGTKRIKKFTYAMTRASLQDGAGANAIWNITNVTRSDRRYLYTTKAWAKAMSENSDVIDYIQKNAADESSLLHPYYADGTKDGISERVNLLLGLCTKADTATYKKYFVDPAGTDEMTDKDYYDFMVWHRGLAIPKARDLTDTDVQRGKQLFTTWGCATCHRAKWVTGSDNYWQCSIVKGQGKLPTYPNQTIYPYTDMVQHRLFMKNDIRTGWCRTTPLWGRGLSFQETGAEDRLHDCRARNEVEAIMWHCYSKQSDAYESALKFYNASKADRNAVVKFIRSI